MVSLIMPSDYGTDILLSSSPVVGSSFLGGGGSPHLSRCGTAWSHGGASQTSCVGLTTVTTIQAKMSNPVLGFAESQQPMEKNGHSWLPAGSDCGNTWLSGNDCSSNVWLSGKDQGNNGNTWSADSYYSTNYSSVNDTICSNRSNEISTQFSNPILDGSLNKDRRSSNRNSLRKSKSQSNSSRRKGTIEPPQIQNLKSCLTIRAAQQIFSRNDDVDNEEGGLGGPYPGDQQPISPTKGRKKVSFADSNGLNLESIKLFTERSDHPPRWSVAFVEQLTGGAKAEPISVEEWALTFSQPIANYVSWKRKLESNYVALENVTIDQRQSLLIGSVKVRNIAFEKHVTIRYTTDNWLTFDDTNAKFIPFPCSSSSYNVYDNFSFEIPLPNSSKADKVEFCVKYSTNGTEFWDNNEGRNYTLVAFKSKKNKGSTSKPKDIRQLKMESWSEFSAWNNLDLCGSPYW